MVKKHKPEPVSPPGMPTISGGYDVDYLHVSISKADNGYILTADSHKSHVSMVFTDKEKMLDAIDKFLEAEPEEEE